jgi:hypothetical protein
LHEFDESLAGRRNIVFVWRRVHASHKSNACATSKKWTFAGKKPVFLTEDPGQESRSADEESV